MISTISRAKPVVKPTLMPFFVQCLQHVFDAWQWGWRVVLVGASKFGAEELPGVVVGLWRRFDAAFTEQIADRPELFGTHVTLESLVGVAGTFAYGGFAEDAVDLITVVDGGASHVEDSELVSHGVFLFSRRGRGLRRGLAGGGTQPHGQRLDDEDDSDHENEDVGDDVELVDSRGIEQLEANASCADDTQQRGRTDVGVQQVEAVGNERRDRLVNGGGYLRTQVPACGCGASYGREAELPSGRRQAHSDL